MLHKLSAATVTRIKAQQVITGLVAAVKELLEYH
jgi:DNA mismatch repair ATPase MutL